MTQLATSFRWFSLLLLVGETEGEKSVKKSRDMPNVRRLEFVEKESQ